jgi:plastocyanin
MRALRKPTPALLLLIALAALSLAISACGDDSDSDDGGSDEAAETVEVDGETANYEGTEAVTSDSIEFEEDDYYFEPTVLTGEAGQRVTLEITNEGDEEHNLTISDQDVDEDTAAGDTASVDVEIPDSGVIQFFCKYHTSQNMRGALAVTGSEPTPTEADDSSSESRGAY